jgi:hypothetical protein
MRERQVSAPYGWTKIVIDGNFHMYYLAAGRSSRGGFPDTTLWFIRPLQGWETLKQASSPRANGSRLIRALVARITSQSNQTVGLTAGQSVDCCRHDQVDTVSLPAILSISGSPTSDALPSRLSRIRPSFIGHERSTSCSVRLAPCGCRRRRLAPRSSMLEH